MTYPQQGWPQQQPQQFGQPGAQQFNPQSGQPVYANQLQQAPQNFGQPPTAPVASAASTMPSFDNAEDPSGFGGLFARPRHLEGRVVVYIPKRADNAATGLDGKPKNTPNIHGDLLVIDGPSPLLFGDKLASGGAVERPNTHSVTVPAFFANVIVGEQEVSKALARAVPPMGNGLMVGVIVRGTKGNRPYLLQTLEADDPRRALARQVYEAFVNKQWTPPEFVEIAPTPGSMAQGQQQGWPMPPQTPGASQQQWQQPQTMGGQVQQWGPVQQQMAPTTPQQFGQQAQAQPAQQAMQQQGQQSDSLPVAPNWDPQQWAALPPVNKQQVWDAINAMQGQQPQPGNMAQPTGF